MDWSIAQAKQQFSEVVRLAAKEPQAIYNRTTPVAMVVTTDDYVLFKEWKARQDGNPLSDSIARLRDALGAAGFDGVEIAPRALEGRPNSFDQMLDEDYAPTPPSAATVKKGRARGAR